MSFDPYNLFDVKDKVALIVGATGAFGMVASKTLAGAGCKLILTGGNKNSLNQITDECINLGAKTESLNLRPNNENNCDKMIDFTVKNFDEINILIVASGINKVSKIDDMQVDTFTSVMDVNVTQSWIISRAATKQMKKQNNGGKIVITCFASNIARIEKFRRVIRWL